MKKVIQNTQKKLFNFNQYLSLDRRFEKCPKDKYNSTKLKNITVLNSISYENRRFSQIEMIFQITS